MTPSFSSPGRGSAGEHAEASAAGGDGSDRTAPGDLPDRCLNCGAVLGGPYCAQCGQEDRREVPTIRALLRELVGDLFEVDSRVWRTLRVLVARPGALTLDYLAGRRRRYLPPFRLFVVTGVVMLLVYSFSGDPPLRVGAGTTAVDGAGTQVEEAPVDPSVGSGEGGLRTRLLETFRQRVRADPEGMQEAFGENLPRMMFLFLPLAAGMLALLYAGSGRRYVEHLVFSVHAHAFVFLELAVARGLRTWLVGTETVLGTGVALGVAVWTLAYFFRALRRVYGEGRLVTSVKFVVLVGGYGVLLNLMLALTAVVTVLLA